MTAVSDSSPLILFARIGRLDLLENLFEAVLIPPAVWQETVTSESGRPGSAEAVEAEWIRVVPIATRIVPENLRLLDLGEREAIALALSQSEQVPILVDDRSARQTARQLGLKVIGCGGVLAIAKDAGLITEVHPILLELRSAGLYLSDSAAQDLLQSVGEERRSPDSAPNQ